MKSEIAYRSLKHKIILASFIGPLLLTFARISGANFWDGLFGVYSNTSMQEALIRLGLWAPILVTIIAVYLCVYYARKFNHTEKRFIARLLPLSIFLPFTLVIFCLFLFMGL